MALELAELGFEWIELSHGIRMSLVPGILRAIEEKVVRVASLHNFCLLPVGVQVAAPNFYLLSSANAAEQGLMGSADTPV